MPQTTIDATSRIAHTACPVAREAMSSNRTDVSDEDDDVQGHGLYFVKRGSIGRNQVPMTRGFARGFDDFDGDGVELVDCSEAGRLGPGVVR